MEDAAKKVEQAVNDFTKGLPITEAQKDEMDLKTAVAREKLATLIVAAYHDVVASKPGDMVSFVFLAEKSLLTLSNDVKRLAGSQKHIGGIALALVIDFVATGTQGSVKGKANARKASLKKKPVTKSQIENLRIEYRNKFYKGVLPRFETEAVMAEVGINGGKNDSWVVALASTAPTIEGFRNLNHEDIQALFTDKDVNPIDQEKINQIFSGIKGGGDIPIARKNLVEAGIDVKDVSAMEQEAKKVRTTSHNLVKNNKKLCVLQNRFAFLLHFRKARL